jgi:LmbE family N-acetylglucosaminyl deacetylase
MVKRSYLFVGNTGDSKMSVTRREAMKGAALAMAAALPLGANAEGKSSASEIRKFKIVIVGAHPDDPESASGGLIALCADLEWEVVSLYLTRGEAGIRGKSHEEAAAIRTAEAEAACKILGSRPRFLSQIDGSTEITPQRYEEVKNALAEEKPDIVITHWPVDSHRDHRVISSLVYDAWHASERAFDLYYFEVNAGEQTQIFNPTHYVDITKVEHRKREACHQHKSQGAKHGFYVLHTEMQEWRGKQSGCEHAEAYVAHPHNIGRAILPTKPLA